VHGGVRTRKERILTDADISPAATGVQRRSLPISPSDLAAPPPVAGEALGQGIVSGEKP
jgi:hypothetical protein